MAPHVAHCQGPPRLGQVQEHHQHLRAHDHARRDHAQGEHPVEVRSRGGQLHGHDVRRQLHALLPGSGAPKEVVWAKVWPAKLEDSRVDEAMKAVLKFEVGKTGRVVASRLYTDMARESVA
ncbi:hypothetical protein OE88DRAFT_1754933 [Heliocybe sulcata]|uniref:Uncharacterized protein n=1 Tax=Heliocybe sulcata TaxID=5364 RepID=A0A5C3MXL9_9AGAM|nr:hypothetical protein OE88DRAFT_1754933 [Heliocybe sulcata]